MILVRQLMPIEMSSPDRVLSPLWQGGEAAGVFKRGAYSFLDETSGLGTSSRAALCSACARVRAGTAPTAASTKNESRTLHPLILITTPASGRRLESPIADRTLIVWAGFQYCSRGSDSRCFPGCACVC